MGEAQACCLQQDALDRWPSQGWLSRLQGTKQALGSIDVLCGLK